MTDKALIAAWTAFAPRDRPRVSHWDAFKAGWEAASLILALAVGDQRDLSTPPLETPEPDNTGLVERLRAQAKDHHDRADRYSCRGWPQAAMVEDARGSDLDQVILRLHAEAAYTPGPLPSPPLETSETYRGEMESSSVAGLPAHVADATATDTQHSAGKDD